MSAHRILVVEDRQETARMVKEIIEKHFRDSAEVTTVPSAEEALLEALEYNPDLLVVDLGLPGLSGDRFIRRFRRICPGTPIIVITGWDRRQAKGALHRLGVDALLFKPFHPQELVEHIERLLPGQGTGLLHPETRKTRATQRLQRVLQNILQEFQAHGVLLLNDEGTILSTVGSPPSEELWNQVRETLLLLISTGAKISRVLQTPYAQNLHVGQGERQTYLLRAIDDQHWLWLVLPRESPWVSHLAFLDAAVEELREALRVLQAQEETAPLSPGSGDPLPSLEPPPPEEAERFWEEVAATMEIEDEEEKPPNVLSFEEAKRQGLLPKDLIEPASDVS